jgi:hypothetical protein
MSDSTNAGSTGSPNWAIPYICPPNVPKELVPYFQPIYTNFQNLIQILITNAGVAPRNNSQILLSNDDPTAILSGNVHRFYCQSTENVAFGALVNLYNFGGALRVRTADATDNTKPAIGFASQPGGIPNGQIGEICLIDGVIIGAYSSSLTIGSYYYLAVGDGGGITTVAPSGGGNLVQKVGLALTTTSLLFNAMFGGF